MASESCWSNSGVNNYFAGKSAGLFKWIIEYIYILNSVVLEYSHLWTEVHPGNQIVSRYFLVFLQL